MSQRSHHTKFIDEDSGIAFIWVILIMPIFAMFMGLAIDVGYMVHAGHQLQIAADASSLAGARFVMEDPDFARFQAAQIGLANNVGGASLILNTNDGNDIDGDIVLGFYNRDQQVFTPDVAPFNAVQVRARRTADSENGSLPLLFGPILGVNDANIQRESIAMIDSSGIDAGLILLSEDESNTLQANGNAKVIVNNGAIHVNSTHNRAVNLIGNVNVEADMLSVVGDIRTIGNCKLPDNTVTDASPILDPLANLPAPDWNPADDLGAINVFGNANLTLEPGYYSGGITVNGNAILTFMPGIYILDGAGIYTRGNVSIQADGVFLYITGTGEIDLGGNGSLNITPPDPQIHVFPGATTYQGISIFQARDNTNTASVFGNSNMKIAGTVYFPVADVEFIGNANQMGNQFIASRLILVGNAQFRVDYQENTPGQGGIRVFMVQ